MRLSFAVFALLFAVSVTHALDIVSNDEDDNGSICGAHPIKKLVAKILTKRVFLGVAFVSMLLYHFQSQI